MRSRAPVGIEWVPVDPRTDPTFEVLQTVARTVVAGAELLSSRQVEALIPHRPLVWLMSPPSPHLAPLLEAASPLVWASREMRSWFPWAPDGEVCQGWFDTSGLLNWNGLRDGTALWAARNHPQKGLLNARVWAAKRGIRLRELSGVPREQVLEAMGTASWFVLLANGYDPAPIACAEAEIAGCKVVTNRLVGRAPVRGRRAVMDWIEEQPQLFYSWL